MEILGMSFMIYFFVAMEVAPIPSYILISGWGVAFLFLAVRAKLRGACWETARVKIWQLVAASVIVIASITVVGVLGHGYLHLRAVEQATTEEEVRELLKKWFFRLDAGRLRLIIGRDLGLDFSRTVAHNPHAPPDILRQIYEGPKSDWYVLDEIAQNPNIPVDILWELVEKPRSQYSADHFYGLLKNPNLPKDLIDRLKHDAERLTHDKNPDVRQNGVSRLKAIEVRATAVYQPRSPE